MYLKELANNIPWISTRKTHLWTWAVNQFAIMPSNDFGMLTNGEVGAAKHWDEYFKKKNFMLTSPNIYCGKRELRPQTCFLDYRSYIYVCVYECILWGIKMYNATYLPRKIMRFFLRKRVEWNIE